MLSRIGAWSCLLFATACGLQAHPGNLIGAVASVQRDGAFKVELTFDVLAFALNDLPERIPAKPMLALLDGPRDVLDQRLAEARRRFIRHFKVSADGRPVAIAQWTFPSTDDVLGSKSAGSASRLPVLLSCTATGTLPAPVHRVAFAFPDVIGSVVLTVERPGQEPVAESLGAGERSSEFGVTLGRAGATVASAPADPDVRPGFWTGLARFVRLGFEHILPRGLDHILFVLGLFLFAGRLRALLWQVTAFTVAHSVTLALSLYGIVRLPAGVVEPLIALSIVLVAADNLRGGELRWWRVVVVFGFGLVHGLGFAGALRDLGLPRGEFLRALIGFNLGVELGQLAIIGLAFAAVGWFRVRPSYRRLVITPASACIAVIALVWTAQRLAGL